MFIRKKVLNSMLYDIEAYKKCIENLRKEIGEVRTLARKGGYINLNGRILSHEDNYLWNSVPVAKVIEKLFEQKKWDIGRTAEVPADIEIRESAGGLSYRRLK